MFSPWISIKRVRNTSARKGVQVDARVSCNARSGYISTRITLQPIYSRLQPIYSRLLPYMSPLAPDYNRVAQQERIVRERRRNAYTHACTLEYIHAAHGCGRALRCGWCQQQTSMVVRFVPVVFASSYEGGHMSLCLLPHVALVG